MDQNFLGFFIFFFVGNNGESHLKENMSEWYHHEILLRLTLKTKKYISIMVAKNVNGKMKKKKNLSALKHFKRIEQSKVPSTTWNQFHE